MNTLHTLALVFGVTLAINVQAQTGAALSPKDTEPLMLGASTIRAPALPDRAAVR